MTLKRGQILELGIEKLDFRGRGAVRVNGLSVLVEGAIPGDEVRVRIFRKKKNHAEARVIDLITPSPFRVAPPCRYSGFCGGCSLQVLDYEKQVVLKREHVMECMEHIGRFKELRVLPVIACDKRFQYRNKMEFSFSDRRWLLPDELSKAGISKDFALGLHVPGTFHKVLDVDACLLQANQGNRLLGQVRRYVRQSSIPPYGLKSHKGFWRFLMLRHSSRYDTWMVNVVTSEGQTSWVQPLADYLSEKYENITSLVHNVNTRRASIAVGEHESLLRGEPFIRDGIGRFEFEISANSFFQTNTAGAERLYEIVRNYAGLTGRETVIDLFSGTGTIPIFLSEGATEIVGIEISESAIRDAQRNCGINQIDNCHFVWGDIKTGLKQVEKKPDVMIVDPPRVGMHHDVVKGVCSMAPARIIYVSCNPASLARDLALLKEDYHVSEIQPVDMFPHTCHIECVARLDRIR